MPIPCKAVVKPEAGGFGSADGVAFFPAVAHPMVGSTSARTAINLPSVKEERIGLPRGVRW